MGAHKCHRPAVSLPDGRWLDRGHPIFLFPASHAGFFHSGLAPWNGLTASALAHLRDGDPRAISGSRLVHDLEKNPTQETEALLFLQCLNSSDSGGTTLGLHGHRPLHPVPEGGGDPVRCVRGPC